MMRLAASGSIGARVKLLLQPQLGRHRKLAAARLSSISKAPHGLSSIGASSRRYGTKAGAARPINVAMGMLPPVEPLEQPPLLPSPVPLPPPPVAPATGGC